MFYSNALSVRLKLLKIKKETRTMRPLRKNKKSPSNSKAEGKKKGWPGEVKVLKKQSIRRRHEKKSARGRCLVSCSGTLFLLNDNVVDKLFSF